MSGEPTPRVTSARAVAITGVAAAGVAALLIWGFFAGRSEATAEAAREQLIRPAVEVSWGNAGTAIVTLPPDLQKQADIQVRPPEAAAYQPQVQAYGSVLDLQPLTDLRNTVANAKAQLAIAEARLAASKSARERAQILHKDGQIFSTAQLQAAEATYQSDLAAVQAGQVQTQNALANAYQAWGPVLGRSLVEETALGSDLVLHKKVLIQVTLPLGKSLPQPPQTASIETSTGQRVKIALVSPATRTDPQIQGVSFFYTADAESDALPGMNVIALLPVRKPFPGVAIPASAVVWLQGRAWVYLQIAAGKFARREILTGEPQPNGGYVVAALPSESTASSLEPDVAQGLSRHESLVVVGAQTLLSQEFSAQIQVGGD
ncbi:MAG: multidrug transporter [Hyphomicrobiales bacterium]|nr:multidrug transporter [Hyphomicrobiales bacterium]